MATEPDAVVLVLGSFSVLSLGLRLAAVVILNSVPVGFVWGTAWLGTDSGWRKVNLVLVRWGRRSCDPDFVFLRKTFGDRGYPGDDARVDADG